jgi:hypothetical protein
MDPNLELLYLYGVLLLGLCGIVYAVTATIRRAWHPERRPPPPRPPPPPRRLAWIRLILFLTGVLVLGLLYMFSLV